MKSKADDGLKESSAQQLSDDSRRNALKKIVAGTGMAVGAAALPSKWTRPIVDRVFVPAHAQTSATTTPPCETTPPCLIIPGTYCWSYDVGDPSGADYYLEITLEADGTVEVDTRLGSNFDPIKVPLTGGSFIAETDGAFIRGEIICDVASISGTVEFMGRLADIIGTLDYTATAALCKDEY